MSKGHNRSNILPLGGSTLRMSFVRLTGREPEVKDPAHSVK